LIKKRGKDDRTREEEAKMSRNAYCHSMVVIVITINLFLVAQSTPPQSNKAVSASTAIQKADAHDTSPALKTIKPSTRKSKGVTKVHPVKPLNYPKAHGPAAPVHPNPESVQRSTDHKFGEHSSGPSSHASEEGNSSRLRGSALLPARAAVSTPTQPSIGGFEGLGDNGTVDRNYAVDSAPSDTNGAVGKTQFVEWVNEALIIFDKSTGSVQAGPLLGNQIWSKFGRSPNGDLHPCEKDNDGDPIVLYDKLAHRWILAQFAISDDPNFYECVAVSTNEDATGTYNRYAYKFPKFNDYPKIGIWTDAYYITFNMFQGNVQVGTTACAMNKDKMIAGGDGEIICLDLPVEGGVGDLLPADLDSIPNPSSGPEYLVNLGFNELQLWTMSIDWSTGTGNLGGPKHLSVAPFTPACENRNNGSCVRQPTGPGLEALGDRLMYRLQYRRFQGFDALFVNHSVDVNDNGQTFTGVRWYEIRNPGDATPKIHQQRTYAPDSNSRWMGSVASDKVGDILLGYSVAGPHVHPSIRFAGRFASDPVGELSAEESVADGGGSQVAGDRWGDYSSISLDPEDDCTFWFAAQYQKDDGSPNAYNWHTYIKTVKFPGCN
jgi:hypothetical protein